MWYIKSYCCIATFRLKDFLQSLWKVYNFMDIMYFLELVRGLKDVAFFFYWRGLYVLEFTVVKAWKVKVGYLKVELVLPLKAKTWIYFITYQVLQKTRNSTERNGRYHGYLPIQFNPARSEMSIINVSSKLLALKQRLKII